MKYRIPLFVLAMILPCLVAASDKPSQQESIELLRQAVAKTNIFELPSFEMKAAVRVLIGGKQADGAYRLQWNGADEWREEVSFPGYSEIQVGGKNTLWVRRNADFMPFLIYNLHRALGFGSSGSPPSVSLIRLDLAPQDSVTGRRDRKERGEKLDCVEIDDAFKQNSELCIFESTKTLARLSRGWTTDFDNDLQAAGTKMFPKVLTLESEGRTTARVELKELVTPVQFPAGTFNPPAETAPTPGCMNPQPAHLVRMHLPNYPSIARSQRIQGTVTIQATIGIDGIPRVRKVIETPSPALEASGTDAIQQWRYTPATCNSQAVEMETILQVNYYIR
jgi:TonB family protein